jgi:organic hydroperoxide reductase OsmC/OhrA
MSEHTATVRWARGSARFTDQRYSRAHEWEFDGGAIIAAAASPHVVRSQFTDATAVDPEEAFVAALASCHMLWFLGIAAGRGFVVDQYEDNASGVLAPDAAGRQAITVVTLRPSVRFASSGAVPTAAEFDALHHTAHDACFLANSVRCDVRCEPVVVSD